MEILEELVKVGLKEDQTLKPAGVVKEENSSTNITLNFMKLLDR
jgi:hypothetical protein